MFNKLLAVAVAVAGLAGIAAADHADPGPPPPIAHSDEPFPPPPHEVAYFEVAEIVDFDPITRTWFIVVWGFADFANPEIVAEVDVAFEDWEAFVDVMTDPEGADDPINQGATPPTVTGRRKCRDCAINACCGSVPPVGQPPCASFVRYEWKRTAPLTFTCYSVCNVGGTITTSTCP